MLKSSRNGQTCFHTWRQWKNAVPEAAKKGITINCTVCAVLRSRHVDPMNPPRIGVAE